MVPGPTPALPSLTASRLWQGRLAGLLSELRLSEHSAFWWSPHLS